MRRTNNQPQILQAQLTQLHAAEAYNTFLESGQEIHRLAMVQESQLRNPNLDLLTRHQIETSRENLLGVWEGFQAFKAEHGMRPINVPAVTTDTHIYALGQPPQINPNTLSGQALQLLQQTSETLGGKRGHLTLAC